MKRDEAKHSKPGLSGVITSNLKYILATIAIIIAIIAAFYGESKLIYQETKNSTVNFNELYYLNVETGERFITLEEAIENAADLQDAGTYNKNTIRVINSKTGANAETTAVEIPEGTEIELDLNGKTVEFNIDAQSEVTSAITNNGTLTISDATATQENPEGTGKLYSSNNTILTGEAGTIQIDSGIIETAVNPGLYPIKNNENSTLTINGGMVNSSFRDISSKGILNITGGIFNAEGVDGDRWCVLNLSITDGSANISGGTFNSKVGTATEIQGNSGSGEAWNAQIYTDVTVTGGTFVADTHGLFDMSGATLTLGDNQLPINNNAPVITAKNGAGVYVQNNATFNFYDGIIKGQTGKSIVGTVVDTPEGYTVKKGTEVIEGVTYETAYLSNLFTVSYDTMNLLYGLNDCGETDAFANTTYVASYMKYSINSGVVTATAKQNDGYGLTTGRVNLEANRKYKFSCTTDGTWGNEAGTDTVEAILGKDGHYTDYCIMLSNDNYEFTPTVSGTYWLRLDVNQNGKTHTFSNISVTYADEQNKQYGTAYGTLPTPSIPGYTFQGWNGKNLFNKDATQVSSFKYISGDGAETSYGEYHIYQINVKPNTTYTITNSGASNAPGYAIFNSSGTRVAGENYALRDTITFTTPSTASYMKFSVVYQPDSVRYDKEIFQIEENDEATAYEPYYVTASTLVTQAKDHILTAILEKKEAVFLSGEELNVKMKQLANPTVQNITSATENTNITSFRRYTDTPSSATLNNAQVVSTVSSPTPIYAWFDNGTIYYYTEALDPKMNTAGNKMFHCMKAITNINLNTIDTSETTDMSSMFYDCQALTELDLSTFDMSKVTNTPSMINNAVSLEKIKTPRIYPSSATITLPKTMINETNTTLYNTLGTSSPTQTWLFEYGGSAEHPKTIGTLQELGTLRDEVNAGDSKSGKFYKLTADIDMGGKFDSNGNMLTGSTTWTAIGTTTNPFKGTFDGNGHVISKLYMNTSGEHTSGLFACISDGTIKNLGIEDSYIINTAYGACALVSYPIGTSRIESCYNKATVSGQKNTGGFSVCTSAQCVIKNCYNAGIVKNNATQFAGGLVGYSQANISNCYNSGTISSGQEMGGIAGGNIGTINHTYNVGTVQSPSSLSHAGIVGQLYIHGKISNSYSSGDLGLYNRGGIVANINGNNGQVLTDNYYLNTTADYGIKDSSNSTYSSNSNNNASPLTASQMTTVLSVVNGENAFVADTNGINGGNPILSWEANRTVVNPNQGTLNNTTEKTTIKQDEGTYYGLNTPTRTGYTFNGWSLSGSGTMLRGNASGEPYGVQARFTKTTKSENGRTYTNYYLNDTSSTDSWSNIVYPSYSYTVGHTYELTCYVRVNTLQNNIVFVRHSKQSNEWQTGVQSVSGVTNGWIKVTINRTFDESGNSPRMEIWTNNLNNGKQNVMDFDVRDIVIKDVTDGTYKYTTDYIYKFGTGVGNITAQWTPNIYQVTLDTQGATTNGNIGVWYLYDTIRDVTYLGTTYNNMRYYADSACTNPYAINKIRLPTKTGYTFGGYYTGTNGTGIQYIDSSGTFINDLYKTVGNKTLYAYWITNNYTITYDYNGVKNYIEPVSSTVTMTGFSGRTNHCFNLGRINKDYLETGDTLKITFNVSYNNLTAVSGQTAYARFQGSGNSTAWNPGFNAGPSAYWSGTGSTTYTYTLTLTESQLTNDYFSVDLRTDYYASGTITITNIKVTRITTKSESVAYSTSQTNPPTPAEKGYILDGWYTARTGGTIMPSQIPAADTTYYAHWTANEYTLTINPNGGTKNGSTAARTLGTKLIYDSGNWNHIGEDTDGGNATRTGYTLTGYYTAATGGTKVYNADGTCVKGTAYWSNTGNGTYIGTSNLTVYAQWTANTYTVKYNGNGNTGGSTANSTHTYNTAKVLTANGFTKNGYTFAGWSTSASDTVKVYDNTEYSKANSGASSSYQEIKQYTINQPFATGDVYQLEVDVKGSGTLTNYFWGAKPVASWTQTDGTTTKTGTAGDGNNGMALTSSWKHYTVRFTLSSSGSTTVNKYLLFRVFGGNTAYIKNVRFFKVSSSSTAYIDGQSVTNLTTTNGGTVNLYALWSANTYSIKFNANGGSGTMSNLSMTYGTAKNLTANAFTRTGYFFKGWNTRADGSGTSYTDKQSVNYLTSTNGATFNLYAYWEGATFDTGENVNAKIKQLAGDSSETTVDTAITKFARYTGSTPVSTGNNVSVTSVPIYIWFDNGTIYWWSETDKPYLNSDCKSMFYNCRGLTSLDVSSFDTSKVTTMQNMFNGCMSLTSLDVSNFDTSNVITMSYMFDWCSSLITIYASNNFVTSQVTNSKNMFAYSKKLKGGAGTTFDSTYVDKTRAHIDGGTSNPGYFTAKSSKSSTASAGTSTKALLSSKALLSINSEFNIGDGSESGISDENNVEESDIMEEKNSQTDLESTAAQIAQIGENTYETLESAIQAAKSR